MSVRLGPFEIESQFAAGGMGEIWRGVHAEQGVPVAIKVMTGPNALKPEYQAEFRREVQAVARLNHPNVVQVYDYGILPEEAIDLAGDLRPGSPYLVMEYASRGSLDADVVAPNWRDLKNVLVSTLSALAHAHAHNVVHRDIKPGNVLLGSHHESPPRIILTDFGIAHAADKQTRTDASELTARSTEEATGTPRYMAPEQFMGKWRDYGPWTDLYAVGIMAYQMTCGRIPFQGSTFMMLAMAHINNPLPVVEPTIDVPDGFDAWIRKMCEKAPHDRFRSAADAAWALADLDDSDLLYQELSGLVGESSSADGSDDDSTDMLATRLDFAPPEAIRVFTMSRVTDGEKVYPEAPPLPVSWEEAQPPAASLSLVGAGLGLFGLRTIPVVDRMEERGAIWNAFKDVYATRKPRAVILRGLSGVGKTRLAEWASQLVSEIGAGHAFRADHAQVPGPMHGLGWMLTTHFRTAGLAVEDMRDRIAAQLDRDGLEDEFTVRAMTEIVRSDRKDEGETTSRIIRFTSPDQRYGVIRKYLARRAVERPVVVSLDDAHWSRDTLAFIRHALDPGEEDDPFAALLIVTVRDEVLQDRPEERAIIDDLASRDDVETIRIHPMETDDIATLVGVELGLSPALAADVARRSGGSPTFAIQLVEDWVKRGVLEVAGSAFVVREGETAELPTDLQTLWESRIDYLIKELSDPQSSDGQTTTFNISMRPDDIRRALQIAAALGRDVDVEEWRHACELSGVHLYPGLVEDMVRVRMVSAKADGAGFSFLNAQVWEGLVERAREQEKWTSDNMLCARMLMSRYGGDQDGLAQRVGRHFLEAKAHRLAVTSLDEAYKRARSSSDHRAIAEICDLLDECYVEMGLPDNASRWAELATRRAMPKIYSANPEVFAEGLELMRNAEAMARDRGKASVLANTLSAEAWASIHSNDLDEGLFKGEEALELAETTNDRRLQAACHRTLGHVRLALHDPARAQAHFERVLELAPDSFQAVRAKQSLGLALLRQGEFGRAESSLREALESASEEGFLMIEGYAHESLGMLAEARGDFGTALEHHEEALTIFELIGSGTTLPLKARENIGRVKLYLEEYEEADELLGKIRDKLESGGRGVFVHLSDAFAAIAAGRGQRDRFVELLEPSVEFDFRPSETHARTLFRAAELAYDNDWVTEANELARLVSDLLRSHEVGLDIAEALEMRLAADDYEEEGWDGEDATEVFGPKFETERMVAPDFASGPHAAVSEEDDLEDDSEVSFVIEEESESEVFEEPISREFISLDSEPLFDDDRDEEETSDEDPAEDGSEDEASDDFVADEESTGSEAKEESESEAAYEEDDYELIEVPTRESEAEESSSTEDDIESDRSESELDEDSDDQKVVVPSDDPFVADDAPTDPGLPGIQTPIPDDEFDDDHTMVGRPGGASFNVFMLDEPHEPGSLPEDVEADFEELSSLTLRPRRPVPGDSASPSDEENGESGASGEPRE